MPRKWLGFILIGAVVMPFFGQLLFFSGLTMFAHWFVYACFASGGILSGCALWHKYWVIPALLILVVNFYLLHLEYSIFNTPGGFMPFL